MFSDIDFWLVQSIATDIGIAVLILLMSAVILELIKTTNPGKIGTVIITVVLMSSPVVYLIKTIVVAFTHL